MNRFFKLIDVILYLLTFIILFYYIVNWNKTIKDTRNKTNNKEYFYDIPSIDNINSYYIDKSGKYMCDTNIKTETLGYANETETNEYKHLDPNISQKLNPYEYAQDYTEEDKELLKELKKELINFENKYSGLELVYMKNKAYSAFMNKLKNKPRTYLQSPNVNPKDDPINLKDQYPRNRKKLQTEFDTRFKDMLNTYFKSINNNNDLYLEKYGWINNMGKPLPLPNYFYLNTNNDDILEYRKQYSRLPQEVLTDYNPLINCKRLTRECVSRIHPNFPMKPRDRVDYEKYLDEIKDNAYVDKYYDVLGMN